MILEEAQAIFPGAEISELYSGGRRVGYAFWAGGAEKIKSTENLVAICAQIAEFNRDWWKNRLYLSQQKRDWQMKVMEFDPITNSPMPFPSCARQFRKFFKGSFWYFNPWTGKMRDTSTVAIDPYGLRIEDNAD